MLVVHISNGADIAGADRSKTRGMGVLGCGGGLGSKDVPVVLIDCSVLECLLRRRPCKYSFPKLY